VTHHLWSEASRDGDPGIPIIAHHHLASARFKRHQSDQSKAMAVCVGTCIESVTVEIRCKGLEINESSTTDA